jgi:DNA polymerase elongation subunit (family B)
VTGYYAAIDTEYKINYDNKLKPYTIYAASIVDSNSGIKNKHIMDFQEYTQPEKELAKWLMEEILKYNLTIGWYSKGVRLQKDDGSYEGKDSDLKVLDSVCKYYDIPSIIGFDKRGVPYVRGYVYQLVKINPAYASQKKFDWYYHIDLYQIYKKPLVKSIIYGNKYRSLGLDAVCQAILGEGKYENLDGLQIQTLSKEQQLEYVAQDANLVMKLSKHDNYEILDLMNAISIITNISFDRVCHTQISTWWKKMVEDKINNGECKLPTVQVNKRKYLGGYVIEPKIGFYDKQAVYVLDVKSLYPSMMISHNISLETVNCDCCKEKLDAKVGNDIMDIINSNILQEERREQYWICNDQKYRGIIPRLLNEFRDERFRQLEIANLPMQLALKNLINGCYGLFGSEFFEYADYRVAELTTAYGRQTLQHMQHIAKEVYDFDIIYGDTDSIFVTNVKKENHIKKFIAECFILLDIDVEVSSVYKKFLITKKKHYIGIHQDDSKEPDIKGMEGIKSDRPIWINKIEKQFADDIKNGKDPTINIRKEYLAMEKGQVPLEELAIRLVLQKDPVNYVANSLQRVVGIESDAKQEEVIKYYKSDITGGGTSNPNLLSRKKYLDMIRTSVENSLTLMGHNFLQKVVGMKELN